MYNWQTYFIFCQLSFHFVDSVLWSTKVFIWINSNLSIFFFCRFVFWLLYLRNHCLIQSHGAFFFFFSFVVLALKCRDLIHFVLSFAYDVKKGSSFFFYMWTFSCPSTICWHFPIEWSQHRVSISWLCYCCSVTKLCLTFCDPMDCSMPSFLVFHYLPEFTGTHVHWVGDVI